MAIGVVAVVAIFGVTLRYAGPKAVTAAAASVFDPEAGFISDSDISIL